MLGRPRRKRHIGFWPKCNYFKPAGVPLRQLRQVELSGDELEAIRLKDLEGLDQENVAKKMKVSRPTIVRILKSGRAKIADSLINTKAIKMEKGNNIVMSMGRSFKHRHQNNRKCGRAFGNNIM